MCRLIRYGTPGLRSSAQLGSMTEERPDACTTNAPTCVNDIIGQRCVWTAVDSSGPTTRTAIGRFGRCPRREERIDRHAHGVGRAGGSDGEDSRVLTGSTARHGNGKSRPSLSEIVRVLRPVRSGGGTRGVLPPRTRRRFPLLTRTRRRPGRGGIEEQAVPHRRQIQASVARENRVGNPQLDHGRTREADPVPRRIMRLLSWTSKPKERIPGSRLDPPSGRFRRKGEELRPFSKSVTPRKSPAEVRTSSSGRPAPSVTSSASSTAPVIVSNRSKSRPDRPCRRPGP